MDKDNKKGGGESGGGSKGADIRRSISEWEREAREAFEHKPQELCVSVNGYLLGSQLIGAELSELTLNVTADERISFCEVFSEQGIRLMMMNVEDLPPHGPGELRQRIELSEARSLEASLLFSNPFPTLYVSYHDPALATVTSTQSVEVEADEPLILTPTPQVKVKRGRVKATIRKLGHKISARIAARRARLLNTRFWMRPGVVTALVAVLLVSATVLIELRRATPVDSAAQLLQRSTFAEDALAKDRNQVLHRTINLEEKNAAGESIARRRIEIWQSAELELSARRLYDDKGSLLAGDWRRADRGQTLYGHGLRPQIKSIPVKNGREAGTLTFENVWQVLPSARELSSLVGESENVTVEERPTEYLINYSRSDQTENGLLKATLVLNRADLHATGQTLTLRQGNEVREYRMVEANFERRSSSTVSPTIFEPDAELLSATLHPTVANKDNGSRAETEPSRPIAPAPVRATPALEVEVLRLLNQAGADMGEQISVTRTLEGLLQVEGLTQTNERKQQLLSAFSPLIGNRAVRVDIQTLDEALARQAKSQASSSGPITIETTQPSSNTLPVDKELRQYLAGRAVPEAQTEEAIRQFAERAIRRSLQVLKHAAALKALSQRFSLEELRSLDAETKGKWLGLIRQHAQALQQESVILRRELAPVFPAVADQKTNEASKIQSDADVALGVQRLFEICSENDRIIRLAFSISPDSSRDSFVGSAQFWRSLQIAEKLAMEISLVGTGNK
jgi:hypothetical protein